MKGDDESQIEKKGVRKVGGAYVPRVGGWRGVGEGVWGDWWGGGSCVWPPESATVPTVTLSSSPLPFSSFALPPSRFFSSTLFSILFRLSLFHFVFFLDVVVFFIFLLRLFSSSLSLVFACRLFLFIHFLASRPFIAIFLSSLSFIYFLVSVPFMFCLRLFLLFFLYYLFSRFSIVRSFAFVVFPGSLWPFSRFFCLY